MESSMYAQGSARSATLTLLVVSGTLVHGACGLPEGPTSSAVSVASSTSGGSTSDATDTASSSTDGDDTNGPGSESDTAVVAMCGNGDVEGDEECDDGNWENDDACLMDCTLAHCGDGFLQDGVESCDDGNDLDNDGCPTTCEFAFCGDGYTQLGVEECDDANSDNDDGCDQACVRARHVFLSSVHFQGNFDGLLGADQKCQALATLARLERPTQYKAWLSDSTKSPETRFHHSPGRYSLLSGTTIADSWDDLTDGTLDNPINETELGEVLDFVGVFTNTQMDGSVLDASYSCENWTTVEGESMTWIGSSGHSNDEWTDSAIANPTFCALNGYLYCFEQ